jgi:hypothetical protein
MPNKQNMRETEGETVRETEGETELSLKIEPCDCEVALNKRGPIDVATSGQLVSGKISGSFEPSYKTKPACKGDGCSEPEVSWERTLKVLNGTADIDPLTNTKERVVVIC